MTPSTYAAFDSSDYRQNTYGPPNHYCDPARSLNNAGAGTLANPWNLTQAMQLAVAGDIVGFLPGVGAVMTSTDNDNIPTFRPTNSGTATNRIVFVTRYAAVALANVATNSNRTQLRHNGTRAVATCQDEIGTGSAMYGTYQTDYITFDGFFVDMAEAQPAADSGVIRVENSRGVHFRNFEIKGTNTNMNSNAVMYRPQNSVDTVLSNFRAYDFSNDRTGSCIPQDAFFSAAYGDQNGLIEHFEIRNTQNGIFLKGTANQSTFNYGTIRYGIVSNVISCFTFNDLNATQLTTLEYNLCHDVTPYGSGIRLASLTSDPRNILIHHNTLARINASNQNTNGGILGGSSIRPDLGSNVTIRDNLIDIDNGPYGHGVDFAALSNLPTMMDYNAYYKNGAAVSWSFNAAQQNSLASWRAATGREANSLLLISTPFTNRSAGIFTIPVGHPAKTASSTGSELGVYATNEVIGVDLGGTTTPPPPPPSNPCDLNGGGVTVVDVQLCVNQALSISPCTTGDIDQNSQCNVIDVQRVVNAALGGPCVTQ